MEKAVYETSQDVELDDEPRWAEVHRSLRLWKDVFSDSIKSNNPDLTARQWALLLSVYLTPDPHTVRGLAMELGVAKPAITRAIDTLSKYGLVKRRKDPADGRNVIIHRTVKGAVFLTEFGEKIEQRRQLIARNALT